MNTDWQQLIDDYATGKLTGEALQQFQERLKDDQAFAMEVRTHMLLVDGIREARKQELKQYLQARLAHREKRGLKAIRPWYYMAAAAACIALLVSIYVLFLPGLKRDPELAQREKRDIVRHRFDSAAYAEANRQQHTLQAKPAPGELPELSTEWEEPDMVREEAMDSVMVGNKLVEQQPAATMTYDYDNNVYKYQTDEGQFKVRSDVRLADTVLIAQVVEPVLQETLTKSSSKTLKYADLESVNVKGRKKSKEKDLSQEEKKAEERADSVKVADKPVITQDRFRATENNNYTSPSAKIPNNYSPATNSTLARIEPYTYQVEFWESPIHYKGYKLSGQKLLLYGIDKAKARLVTYAGRLYLLNAGEIYMLVNDNNFHPYEKVADKALTEILK